MNGGGNNDYFHCERRFELLVALLAATVGASHHYDVGRRKDIV